MVIKKFVPVIILILLSVTAFTVMKNPPDSQRGGRPAASKMLVETLKVTTRDYQIKVGSYGTAQPRTQTMLVSQVGGQVTAINPNFRPGGFFKRGEILVTIDPRDYKADVHIAEASLMDALQAEAQEVARSEQAIIDWRRLGYKNEQPSDLVLRKPQLSAAKARVLSAESGLVKTKLKLERTQIRAAFDGRILNQMVDIGEVVSNGFKVAEIYATNTIEVRLPLRNADLNFVTLPERSRTEKPSVTLSSELGGSQVWQGEIMRTEGAIDENSRQLHIVAQIKDPFAELTPDMRPIKIGEYLTAEISGKMLQAVVVIPSRTIYQNTYVYIVDAGLLHRREIAISWQNGVDAIITSGLIAGDTLVTTALGQVSSGTAVRVASK